MVAPLMLASAVLALRGSLRAYLVWLGVVAFTLYSYVIYVFSVPFGALFPVWAAVLGISLFSLIGGLHDVDADEVARRFGSPRMVKASAGLLLVVAGLFALLWLSEDVPALLAGSMPQSALDMGLPTNPVHVLDYVFFLPAAIITGIGLLRRNHFSHVAAPALLVLLALTGVPILITPLVQEPVHSHGGTFRGTAWGMGECFDPDPVRCATTVSSAPVDELGVSGRWPGIQPPRSLRRAPTFETRTRFSG